MKFLRTYEEYTFHDLFPKNEWMQLSKQDMIELKDSLWVIIDNAYGPLGGHVRIKNAESIINDPDLSFWRAIDIDRDPDADIVIFGRHTDTGYKISGWGHDGEKASKKELMSQLASILKRKGFWIEVSGRPSEILLKQFNCSYVDTYEKIMNLFPGSNINWLSEHPTDPDLKNFKGFYQRVLEDGTDTEIEIVLGNP